MIGAFQVGEHVRVQSPLISGDKPFDALVTGAHVSGYYVQRLNGKDEDALYVTYDEVQALPAPPAQPTFMVGSQAKLGGPCGPNVLVLAVFSRGLLIAVHVKHPVGSQLHIMEVPARDLYVPEKAEVPA